MKKIIRLIAICLFLIACCDEPPIEVGKYSLSNQQRSLLPYEKEDEVNFVHSNGYEFKIKTVENEVKMESFYDFCEWTCCGSEYTSYEVQKTILESNYPNLSIEFDIEATALEREIKELRVSLSYGVYSIINYSDTEGFTCNDEQNTKCHDSLLINDTYFYNVVECYIDTFDEIDDEKIIRPTMLLLNSESGLLKIKMSNDESYSIDI